MLRTVGHYNEAMEFMRAFVPYVQKPRAFHPACTIDPKVKFISTITVVSVSGIPNLKKKCLCQLIASPPENHNHHAMIAMKDNP